MVSQSLFAQSEVGFQYHPPLLPLSLVWSTSSGWGIQLSESIATPLGVFSGTIAIHNARRKFPEKRLLVIIVGSKSFVYALSKESFRLELPNNLKGKIILTYDGNDLIVVIPHPEKIIAPRYTRLRSPSNGVKREKTIGKFRILVPPEPGGIIEKTAHIFKDRNRLSWWETAKADFEGLVGAKSWLYVTANKRGAKLRDGEGPFAWPPTPLPALIKVRSGTHNLTVWKDDCGSNAATVVVKPNDTLYIHFTLPCK